MLSLSFEYDIVQIFALTSLYITNALPWSSTGFTKSLPLVFQGFYDELQFF